MAPKQVMINPKPSALVKKAEDLITAKFELPELSIKLMSTLISMLRADDTEFAECYILKISDWKELSGRTGKDLYSDLDRATTALMSNPIHIQRPNNGFLNVNWLSEAEWVPGSGEMELRISPKLKPYLLELKARFLEYGIENILKLKSGYVIRLYELLKHEFRKVSSYNNQKKVIYEIDLKDFREMFQVPESYQYSSGIKLRILDKAQEQFKEKTDIGFEYKEIKRGRAVNVLEFTIFENSKGSNDFLRDERAFIEHIRKNYVNKQLLSIMDKEEKHFILQCSEKGRLFDLNNHSQDLTKEQSKYFWSLMFKLAKEGKLKILTDNI